MRVIAGSAGGVPLHTPRTDLRPTMDRVKAAIFSSLGEKIIGARVLDLFAGSGSLGIEALSRGAESADFVESSARAAESIQRNLEKTQLAGANARIHAADVFSFLDRLPTSLARQQVFNIVFADPPYAKQPGERDFAPELLHSRALQNALASDGVFVLEKMPGAQMPKADEWEILRAKTYGATEVVFLRLKMRGENDENSAAG